MVVAGLVVVDWAWTMGAAETSQLAGVATHWEPRRCCERSLVEAVVHCLAVGCKKEGHLYFEQAGYDTIGYLLQGCN